MAVSYDNGSQVSRSGAQNASSQYGETLVMINTQITIINDTRVQFLNSSMWSGQKKDAFDTTFCVFVNDLVTLDGEASNGLDQYNSAMNTRYAADGQSFQGSDSQKSNIQASTDKSDDDMLVADFASIKEAIQKYNEVIKSFSGIIEGINNIINIVKAVWIDAAAQIFLQRMQKFLDAVQKALEELQRAAKALDDRLTEATNAVNQAKQTIEGISQFTQAFSGMY